MEEDLKEIKKKYGEKMAHYCREQFPILLEKKGLLPTLIESNFNEYHHLFDDLEKNSAEVMFKNYIYNLVNVENNLEIMIDKTPEELMSMAGYTLKECTTEEEIDEYKKYYAENEELCTFKGNRLERCRVFFAVKKDVDLIKRENFPYPKREDAYGTSVISIQFEKDGTNTLSIKNRYNHRVNNPDATLSNNLDNIIPGLTKSFEIHKGIKQNIINETNFEIPGYVKANDGKFYKYNREINNIYYCPDNIIIDNFNVLKYDKSRYLLIDHLIIDLSLKKIIIYDNTLQESIHNLFDNIEKISILSNNDIKIITIINKDNRKMVISIDKFNNIKNIKLINCFNIPDNFLKTSAFIESCSLPNTITIGNNFLRSNYMLHNIYAPTLEVIQDDFLALNGLLKDLNLPSLKEVGNNFLKTNEVLSFINVPSLEIIKDNFLRDNKNLRKLSLPNIKYTGKYMLDSNRFVKITQTERSK